MNNRKSSGLFLLLAGPLAWALTFGGGTTLHSDVVWLKGNSAPQYGRIISQSEKSIEFSRFENNRLAPSVSLPRVQIEQLVVNFDRERLEKLTPSDPAAYRDYAEELAAQSADPTARDLARRLYLIAAASSPGERESELTIRQSGLAGLVGLANSADERRKLKMLQILVSPNPVQLIDPTPTTQIPTADGDDRLTLDLIHAIRSENLTRAVELLAARENRAVFATWSEICSLDELDSIARVNRPSKAQLSKLLQVEVQILSRDPNLPQKNGTSGNSRDLSWGDSAMRPFSLPGLAPSFETVTDYDPGASIFREGRWVTPDH